MKIEYKTCGISFSDGSESYTETEYCVGTDFLKPVKIDKYYFKD